MRKEITKTLNSFEFQALSIGVELLEREVSERGIGIQDILVC